MSDAELKAGTAFNSREEQRDYFQKMSKLRPPKRRNEESQKEYQAACRKYQSLRRLANDLLQKL